MPEALTVGKGVTLAEFVGEGVIDSVGFADFELVGEVVELIVDVGEELGVSKSEPVDEAVAPDDLLAVGDVVNVEEELRVVEGDTVAVGEEVTVANAVKEPVGVDEGVAAEVEDTVDVCDGEDPDVRESVEDAVTVLVVVKVIEDV